MSRGQHRRVRRWSFDADPDPRDVPVILRACSVLLIVGTFAVLWVTR